MNICRSFLPLATVCLSGVAFLSPGRALAAPIYTTYVTSTNSGNVLNYGLTTGGSVVLENASSLTFTVFTPPSTTVSTGSTAPILSYDNGASCSVANMGPLIVTGAGRCNGNLAVFGASTNSQQTSGLYLFNSGDLSLTALFPVGQYGFGNLLLNARGDVAAVVASASASDRNVLLAVSTPEPSSLMLLGTGLVGVVGVVRRRVCG